MSELLRVRLVLKILQLLYKFPIHLNFSETPFTCGMYTEPRRFIWITATLGINNRVSETLGINVELKITSQGSNFIKHSCRSWHMVVDLLDG
jgi:hypothetical protein